MNPQRPWSNSEPPSVEGQTAEHLSTWLLPPGDPLIVAQVGQETEHLAMGPWRIYEGETFTGREGQQRCSWRFMKCHSSGEPMAVMQVIEALEEGRRPQLIVANLFVALSARRQGVASELLACAEAWFQQKLLFSPVLSQAGEAWCMGVKSMGLPSEMQGVHKPSQRRPSRRR